MHIFKKVKKGFTLVEIIATLVIMGLVFLVAIPSIVTVINTSKEDLYERQVETIINGAKKYLVQHTYDITWMGNVTTIPFKSLAKDGYIGDKITNPLDSVEYNMDESRVIVTKVLDYYNYEVAFETTDNSDFVLKVTNPEVISCSVKGTYKDPGVFYKATNELIYGRQEDISLINKNLSKAGVYKIKYSHFGSEMSRMVLITNSKAPVIKMKETRVIISSTNTNFNPADYVESVYDECEGDIKGNLTDADLTNGQISSNVLLGTAGEYMVNYTVINKGGVVATARLLVEITPVELIVKGSNPDTVMCHNTNNYNDLGAYLNQDESIVVKGTPLSLKNAGTYKIDYRYVQNTFPIYSKRTVIIKNENMPVINLTQSTVVIPKTQTVFNPMTYVKSVTDPCEGNIVSNLTDGNMSTGYTTSNIIFGVNGTYTVKYYVINKGGKKAEATMTVKVEVPKPVIAMPTPNGNNGWFITAPLIDINYDSGFADGIEYAISTDGATYGSWQFTDANAIKVNADGATVRVRVRAKAADNRYSEIVYTPNIKVEATRPTAPTLAGGSAAWAKSRTINITGNSNSASGIAKYQYYISTSSSSLLGGAWADLSTSATSQLINKHGSSYIFFRALSNAGGVGNNSAAQVVNVDTAKPGAPSVAGSNTNWVGSRNYTLGAPSSLSGIKNYEYFVSNSSTTPGDGQAPTATSTSNSISINASGKYVFFRAVNNVGTKGTWTSYNNHYVDNAAPGIPGIGGASSAWAQSRYFTLTAPNVPSGVKNYEYFISNSASTPGASQAPTGTSGAGVTIATTGQYIYFRAVSNVGVKGTWSNYQNLYVDLTAASITAKSASITITQGANASSSGYFNVGGYGISGGSVSCNYANTSTIPLGTYTLTCTSRTGAGKTATASLTVNAVEPTSFNQFIYFTDSTSYTIKDAGWYRFVVVGRGGNGGNGGLGCRSSGQVYSGGAGGSSGAVSIHRMFVSANTVVTLTVDALTTTFKIGGVTLTAQAGKDGGNASGSTPGSINSTVPTASGGNVANYTGALGTGGGRNDSYRCAGCGGCCNASGRCSSSYTEYYGGSGGNGGGVNRGIPYYPTGGTGGGGGADIDGGTYCDAEGQDGRNGGSAPTLNGTIPIFGGAGAGGGGCASTGIGAGHPDYYPSGSGYGGKGGPGGVVIEKAS